MWVDSEEDAANTSRTRAQEVLAKARRIAFTHTIPVRVNGYTTVLVTPEQAADPNYMQRFKNNYKHEYR